MATEQPPLTHPSRPSRRRRSVPALPSAHPRDRSTYPPRETRGNHRPSSHQSALPVTHQMIGRLDEAHAVLGRLCALLDMPFTICATEGIAAVGAVGISPGAVSSYLAAVTNLADEAQQLVGQALGELAASDARDA